jgi:tetratricopeptide (TPR) repeat protein
VSGEVSERGDSATVVAGAGGTLEGSLSSDGTARPLEAGTLIDDTFEIERVLGAGGMGVVYRALDIELDRLVALKLAHASDNTESMARLLREARSMAKLTHPNVITVHAVGVHEGQVYIAMELVEGDNLTEWLGRRKRDPAEVVDVFVQAGRGLAAAHAVDLVHRDFKPDNVLVGRDGRVRVGDFGLARAGESELQSSTSSHNTSRLSHLQALVDDKLTTTGALLGTPAYMAPEQYGGGPVDARADQFAYCVALYESLYGKRPFSGRRAHELFAAIIESGPPEAPPEPRVPRHVVQAMRRGLSPDPDERYPDFAALLAELDPAPSRRGRTVGIALVAAGALSIGAIAGGTFEDPDPCLHAAAPIEELWNAERARRLERSFAQTGLAYAQASASSVVARLDQYAADWATQRREACEATHVHHRQSGRLLDQRYACLDRGRRQLEEVVANLLEATPKMVPVSVDATTRLPALSACGDVDRLSTQAPLPDDPLAAERVEQARAKLDTLDARAGLDLYDGGDKIIAEVQDEAQALDYDPLVADAALARARYGIQVGRPSEARASAQQAFFTARGAGHDHTAFAAASLLVYAAAMLDADAEAARLWLRHADAELRHMTLDGGQRPEDTIQFLMREATVFDREGKSDEAERVLRDGLALAEQNDFDELRIAHFTHRIAISLDGQGRFADANEYYADAIETFERLLGPDHPELIDPLSNMSINYADTGQAEKAIPLSERAIEICERALGPDTEQIVVPLMNYGVALQRVGRIEDAIETSKRAIAVTRTIRGDDSPDLPHLHSNLGLLYGELARHEEALTEHERALEISARLTGTQTPDYALYAANHAVGLQNLERDAEALIEFRSALGLFETTLGPDHPTTAVALLGIGRSLTKLDRYGDAIEPLERALAIRSAPGRDPMLRAEVELVLARALRGTRRDPERARTLTERALTVFRAENRTERIAEAERDLADPGG